MNDIRHTGFSALREEFSPDPNPFATESNENIQILMHHHKHLASVIKEVIERIYKTKNINVFFWAKSPNEGIIEFSFKNFEPTEKNTTPQDDIKLQQFIADIQSNKSDLDDIYFVRKSFESNNIFMSFNISKILPHLQNIIASTQDKHQISHHIDKISTFIEKWTNRNLPKYNN